MSDAIVRHYLEDSILQFRKMKQLAEKAMSQISDEEFFALLDEESNSIALTVKHISGNLRSRWTAFLTTDGEKDWRNRDTEFHLTANDSRESLMQAWEAGWQILFEALEPLRIADFDKKITIRGEPHSIVQAINRQLTHYSYHIGQIVFLAKHLKSAEWKTLSVARNRSEEFRQEMLNKNQK
jgi:hypothetical protein